MRVIILTTSLALLILTLVLACSRQSTQPTAKDQLVNVLTSTPAPVTLTTGDKIRFAKYVIEQVASLTNLNPRNSP